MLHSLQLERRARDLGSERSPARIRAELRRLIRSGADHPEQLARLVLETLRQPPLADSPPDMLWALRRLEELADLHPEVDGVLGAQLAGYEAYLFLCLGRRHPAEVAGVAPGLRQLFQRAPWFRAGHLLTCLERALQAAREDDAYLFQALVTYACERLRVGSVNLRPALAAALDLYRTLQAFRTPGRTQDWYLPTLRALSRLLDSPAARAVIAEDPALVSGYLEGLWEDLVAMAAEGEATAFFLLLDHLVTLARWLPMVPDLRAAFGHLDAVLAAAPGGVKGGLARRARAMCAPVLPAPGSPPSWDRFHERATREGRIRTWKARIRTALRPEPRAHLAFFLEALGGRRAPGQSVGALYSRAARFPLPLIVLYHPRGEGQRLARAAQGHLDVHFQKMGGAYRMTVVSPHRGEVLTAHTFLDEGSTAPFRGALARSGGAYVVALVEFETLEVSALRFQNGYLDFTGAYFRGIEKVMNKDLEGAIREFEKALAANPRLKGVNCHLGLCYRKLGRTRRDIERSNTCYQRELSIDPDSSDALNNLGVLSLASGDLEEALQYFERAVRAEPTHLTGLANLTTACLAMPHRAGAPDRVRGLLKRMYVLDPHAPALGRLVEEASTVLQQDVLGLLRTEPL